jgi:hypothetical protein
MKIVIVINLLFSDSFYLVLMNVLTQGAFMIGVPKKSV